MKRLAPIGLALLLATSAMAEVPPAPSAAVQAEPEPSAERLALARELVEVTGGAERLKARLTQAFNASGGDPAVNARFVRVISAHAPQFIEAMAQSYARNFSSEELRADLVYFRSPVGRAIAAKSLVLADRMTRLSLWSQGMIGADPAATPPAPPAEPSPAPSPDRLAAAGRLMEVMGMGRAMAEAPFTVGRALAASLPEDGKDPKKDAETERQHARAIGLIPEFNRRAALVYADVFTLDELQAATAFYSSPAGKALLERNPAVQAEAQRQLAPLMKTLLGELFAPE